jgi:hypothetical protein
MGNIVNINSKKNKIVLDINYPGEWGNSSICGIKLISSEKLIYTDTLAKLRDALKFEEGYYFKNTKELKPMVGTISGGFGATISYGLETQGTYMVNIVISTKSGEAFKKVIQNTLGLSGSSLVGVVSTKCNDNKIVK